MSLGMHLRYYAKLKFDYAETSHALVTPYPIPMA